MRQTIPIYSREALPQVCTSFPCPITTDTYASWWCSQAAVNGVITFHQNKEEEGRLKTLGKDKADEEEEEEKNSPPLPPLKRKVASIQTSLTKKIKVDTAKDKAVSPIHLSHSY